MNTQLNIRGNNRVHVVKREVLLPSGQGRIAGYEFRKINRRRGFERELVHTSCMIIFHLFPWSPPDYRTDNSSLVRWRWWLHFYLDPNCNLSKTRTLCYKLIDTSCNELRAQDEITCNVPSITNWCARATSVSPLLWLNASEMSCPNVYPAPRGDIPHPQRSSGSDHSKSHMGPSWGTSCTRSMERTWSRVSMDGESPPCKQNIWNERNQYDQSCKEPNCGNENRKRSWFDG